jgi:hypothetical protein
MAYQVVCGCGRSLPVSEDMAGSDIICACGRTVRAPMLTELARKLPAERPVRQDQALASSSPSNSEFSRMEGAGWFPTLGGFIGMVVGGVVGVAAYLISSWNRGNLERMGLALTMVSAGCIAGAIGGFVLGTVRRDRIVRSIAERYVGETKKTKRKR